MVSSSSFLLPSFSSLSLALAAVAFLGVHGFTFDRMSMPQSHQQTQHKEVFLRGPAKRSSSSADSTSSSSAPKGFLQIAEAPPKLLEARQHGKTILECSASGNPAPLITWYKDGTPLINDFKYDDVTSDFSPDSMSETKSRISLDCIGEEDAGLYECVAHTSTMKTSVGTEVHVVSELIYVFWVAVAWLLECFQQQQKRQQREALSVDDDDHAGFDGPACVPPHRLSSYQSSPPQIIQWMSTYMQLIGTDAHLVCRTEGGRHRKSWVTPEGDVVEMGTTAAGTTGEKYKVLSNGDLIVRDLTFDDMGMFKCTVANEHGEDMQETFVYPHTGM